MMPNKVKKLISTLDSMFPFKKAEEWDKVGHFAGDENKVLSHAIVALDLTKEVMDKAVELKAEAIIIHHPFIFGDVKTEEFASFPYKKQLYSRIKNTEINVIVLHTNYDQEKDGMIKAVSKSFGKPILTTAKYGFMIEKEFKMSEISNILNKELNTPVMAKYLAHEHATYSKIAFLPGAGDVKEIISMHQEGAQLIITSDIKWSTWVLAKELGINLMQVSHSIEQAFVHHIATIIRKQFSGVKVTEILPTIF